MPEVKSVRQARGSVQNGNPLPAGADEGHGHGHGRKLGTPPPGLCDANIEVCVPDGGRTLAGPLAFLGVP
ncbi:hypothetical protein ACCO45_008197 [Purpureocillium lilacinum]|uniref:Uncharacterized protein n=1 Tax=Purpureocillium lilacinum TaxID=33203 RepID=A0ACC4DMT7_PURLI